MEAIILLGGPGAGKGTLAEFIKANSSYIHVSTGDMLRSAMKADSELGKQAKAFMDAGNLVPDELILDMIRERVAEESDSAQFMFDGFPRTIDQAKGLKALCESVDATISTVFNLRVDQDSLVERLSARRTCRSCGAIYHLIAKPPVKEGICDVDGGELYQRADDCKETILNRLDVYTSQTSPLINFYQDAALLSDLDASRTPAEIAASALDVLNG